MIRSDPLLTLFWPHHMSDSICLRDDLASAWLASLLRTPNAPAEEQRFLPRKIFRLSVLLKRLRKKKRMFYGPKQKSLKAELHFYLLQIFIQGL